MNEEEIDMSEKNDVNALDEELTEAELRLVTGALESELQRRLNAVAGGGAPGGGDPRLPGTGGRGPDPHYPLTHNATQTRSETDIHRDYGV
jgi:hypothetical protein